jgi:hypothetical protein
MEKMLRSAIRKVISRLANFTPGVIYYPSGWPVKINNTLRSVASINESGASTMSTAAASIVCAMSEHLPRAGVTAEIELTGVSYGGSELGNFKVTLERIA